MWHRLVWDALNPRPRLAVWLPVRSGPVSGTIHLAWCSYTDARGFSPFLVCLLLLCSCSWACASRLTGNWGVYVYWV
jgi:hypothetical protein